MEGSAEEGPGSRGSPAQHQDVAKAAGPCLEAAIRLGIIDAEVGDIYLFSSRLGVVLYSNIENGGTLYPGLQKIIGVATLGDLNSVLDK